MHFSALASRSGFGPAVSGTVVHMCIVFCNSMSADRIVVAASSFLGATAACAIPCLLQLNIVNRIGMAATRSRSWFASKFSTFWRL